MNFKTLDEVKAAVNSGNIVCWKNDNYRVVVDMFDTWIVTYRPWSRNPNSVGLFWQDGTTSDYSPEDFYIMGAA